MGHFQFDGKTFNYQTLLMLMVITENLDELRQIEPVHFSKDTDLSQRNATISFFTFASSVIPAIVEEESQEQSQSMSNTERTIINPTIVESSQASTMILQKFTLNEAEAS